MTEVEATRGWPASLLLVEECIGLAATLKLIEAYGGTACHIPEKADPSYKLVQTIGVTATEALIRDFGSGPFEVALLAVARQKRRLIVGASGTAREVARRYGVTERWVRFVRADMRADIDERQIDMFTDRDGEGGSASG